MALSTTRPDPSSPEQVSAATFATSRRGFDSDEVRRFLRLVAAELARLQDRERQLEEELHAAQQSPSVSLADLDAAIVNGVLSDEAARIIAAARESAAQIKASAEEASSRLLTEANEEVQRIRAEAEVEAGRRRQDASRSADDELQMAKQQGRDMVNEARAYRERVLGELARRRELARQQIEQLIQSRDRLVQSFERSRQLAVEVIAEMSPATANSELVDLSPITGPVPVVPTRPQAPPVTAPTPPPMPEPEVAEIEVVEPVEVVEPAAPPVAPAVTPDPVVDDLFARLREQTVKPTKPKPVAKPRTSKSAPQKRQQSPVFDPSPPEPAATVAHADSPFGRRDAQLAPLIAAGARNLKRVLADEQNDVLLALRGREPVRSIAAVLPATEQHLARYADAIASEVQHAARAGASGMADLEPDQIANAVVAAIEALAMAVVTPLRERLDRAVVAADGDNSELVTLTRTIYREWKTRRIDEHIDDVLLMAFGRGAFAAIAPGTPVCWAIDPNGPSCPDAEDNALAGAVSAGEKFPTEHVAAPAHEGCRCLLLPVAR